MDWSPPGSSVHGIFQARILEWVAISSCRRSSQPRDRTHVSCVSCISWQTLYQLSHWGSHHQHLHMFTNLEALWSPSFKEPRCTWAWDSLLLQLASSLGFSLATSLLATFLRRWLSQPCHSCPVFAHSGTHLKAGLPWPESWVSPCPAALSLLWLICLLSDPVWPHPTCQSIELASRALQAFPDPTWWGMIQKERGGMTKYGDSG